MIKIHFSQFDSRDLKKGKMGKWCPCPATWFLSELEIFHACVSIFSSWNSILFTPFSPSALYLTKYLGTCFCRDDRQWISQAGNRWLCCSRARGPRLRVDRRRGCAPAETRVVYNFPCNEILLYLWFFRSFRNVKTTPSLWAESGLQAPFCWALPHITCKYLPHYVWWLPRSL